MDRPSICFRNSGTETRQHEHQCVDRHPGEGDKSCEGNTANADDSPPTVAIGEPPHGERTKHEERSTRRRDEDNPTFADVEGSADVGCQQADGGGFEFVKAVYQGQHHNSECAPAGEALTKGHLFTTNAWEQIVGEENLVGHLTLGSLGLLREHGRGQCRQFSGQCRFVRHR